MNFQAVLSGGELTVEDQAGRLRPWTSGALLAPRYPMPMVASVRHAPAAAAGQRFAAVANGTDAGPVSSGRLRLRPLLGEQALQPLQTLGRLVIIGDQSLGLFQVLLRLVGALVQ